MSKKFKRKIQQKKGKECSLRIIAGSLRGRKISFIDDVKLRPTGGRVRETLFNWLMPFIVDASCLDLFSGSGILGFESVSRGAKEVIAIDKQFETVEKINSNIQKLNIEKFEVIFADALKWLKECNKKFDIIYLDPPYGMYAELKKCLNLILANDLVHSDSRIYIETNVDLEKDLNLESERVEDLKDLNTILEIVKAKKAGNVYYYLARKRV